MTNGNAGQNVTTTDLGLATYLMWKGATLAAPEPWNMTTDGKGHQVLEFNLARVNPDDVARYRRDADGIQRLNACRRHLLRIIATETKTR